MTRKAPLWRRFADSMAQSVRHKLLALVLVPLLVGVPGLLLIVFVWGTEGYNRLMINKVSADLGAATEFFDRFQSEFAGNLDSFAQSHRLISALDDGDRINLLRVLQEAARRQGLDYLLLLNPDGVVMTGMPAGLTLSRTDQIVVQAAKAGQQRHGLEVFSPEQLQTLTPVLRRRAHLDLISTPLARPRQSISEDRGLMLTAGIPVMGRDGRLRAILEAGMLLNGNLDIVDRLNDLVYRESSLPTDSEGTATLFLDDVRIATSVRLKDGQRALGTRVSQAVYDKVMQGGQAWLGVAQVVDRQFISGYAPLYGLGGQRVGMLYVGFLETPLKDALTLVMLGIFAAFLLVSGLGFLASLHWARAIFLPLEQISRVIERVENQDDSARVGTIPSRDELGRLAQAFDRLLDNLAARREELRKWGLELDRKVAERTDELKAASETLTRAQAQLVMNEKLTAIGELTAGVAHEINNPVAVMQGNLDLMKEILGPDADAVQDEIRLIDEQISRIQAIVNKLLQFARPGDFAGYAENTDIATTISDCLVLTRHNLRRSGVAVETRLDRCAGVEINRVELQQVLINLIVNALQAMPEGGTLTLSCRELRPCDQIPFDADPFEGVMITVQDTGLGIAPGDLSRIFDPFFTTKKTRGTGLGLSISYSIIQRYGGRITVDSKPGRGACFTLWLRHHAIYSEQPLAPVFSARFNL